MAEPDVDEPKAKIARLDDLSITPILPAEITSECVDLIDCYMLKVAEKKEISFVLSVLAQRLPLSADLAHLKRVNVGGTILLGRTSAGPIDDDILKELRVAPHDLTVVSVAATKPMTRRQYEWAKERWPTSFHPDKKLEALLDGSYFDAQLCTCIREHLALAKQSAKKASIGCVLARRDGAMVAVAHDSVNDGRPLAHAVLNAIELVARSQGGGSRFIDTQETTVDFRYDTATPSDGSNEYLCSGWDCIVTDEPCTMCAMALLHSRIGRVFYLRTSPSTGALGSKLLLHCEKLLNHKFDVFRIHSD